jgi:hypothetical protein
MEHDVDLVADLNAQDDDGLGWSTLGDARDRSRVHPGAMLLAGNRQAQAVVRVVTVDDDGQVHFAVLPGSVDKNRHRPDGGVMGRRVSAIVSAPPTSQRLQGPTGADDASPELPAEQELRPTGAHERLQAHTGRTPRPRAS